MSSSISKSNYSHQSDVVAKIDNRTPLFSCEVIHNVVDPQVRFLTIGIVNVVEPLKNENVKNIKYVLYDNIHHTVIMFDVYELYNSYIKHGVPDIKTKYGNYRLTQKTIDDIIQIIKGYDTL